MQINSASSYTPQAKGSLAVDNQNQVAQQRDRLRVQQETQQAQQSAQQAKDQEQKSSQVNRFDVDEKSLALVEKNQQKSAEEQSSSQLSSQTNNQSKQSSKSTTQTDYDSPSQQNKSAIAAYSSVGNIAQRENIQQVFGVDLLA